MNIAIVGAGMGGLTAGIDFKKIWTSGHDL